MWQLKKKVIEEYFAIDKNECLSSLYARDLLHFFLNALYITDLVSLIWLTYSFIKIFFFFYFYWKDLEIPNLNYWFCIISRSILTPFYTWIGMVLLRFQTIFIDYVEMILSSISNCILLIRIVKARYKLFRIISIHLKDCLFLILILIFHFHCIVRITQMSRSKALYKSCNVFGFYTKKKIRFTKLYWNNKARLYSQTKVIR